MGYAVLHHEGTLLADAGEIGDTRWADWVDIATPFVIVGAAAGALRAGRGSRSAWVGFLLGAILYVEGHGIHLAANSIGNALPGEDPDIVHLWDEVVGHYLWYGGFAVLVAVLAATMAERRARGGAIGFLLAALVGFTHFTNSVEGGVPVMGIATAAVFTGWGLLTRDGMGRLLLTAYALSLVLFAAFGVWQGGFPEFSELGWT